MIQLEELEALKKGDPKAFQSLVSDHSERVYNLCLSILQNQSDSEDVTQEVFTTVFLSISQFKGDSKLSTWIYRIAVNKCQEHIRSKSRRKRFGFLTTLEKAEISNPINLSTSFQHPGIELEKKERAAILFAAIDRLPENQKIAFTLHKIDGLPYEEVAEVMSTSLSSIESLIFRARQKLRQLLADYYNESEK